MRRFAMLPAVALAFALCPLALRAQEEAFTDEEPSGTLPETVVEAELSGETPVTTPTRTDSPIGDVGSATTVIDAEMIDRRHSAMVEEVLRSTPGLDVVRSGPTGGLTTVFLRGANGAQTKVLMDGVPLNDPSSATRAFDFSTLSTDDIERIEIVRGPQSTLYGSDAIGGVVNIITKRGQGPMQARATFLGGSYGTNRDAINVSGGTNKFHYSAGGSFLYTNGFSAASTRLGNTEADSDRLGTATGRFGWTPSENFEVDYVFRWLDSRTEIDDAGFSIGQPPVDDPTRLNLTNGFFSGVTARSFAFDGGVEQRVSYYLTDYRRRDTDDLFAASFEGQTMQFEYQANLQLTETNLLTAGADHWNEGAENSYSAAASQYKSGVYLQDQIQLGERSINTVGFRWDDYNFAGPAQTYQFRSVYKLDEIGTSFHGSLGTGFRVPSLAENQLPFGNPNLSPEESRGWDFGVAQRLLGDTVRVEFSYYRNDFTNLILFDPTIPPFGGLVNIGRARTHGVEVIGLCYLTDATWLNATYTRTDTLNIDTGAPLPRRPRDKGTVGITHRFCDCRAEMTLYAILVGERTDSNDGSLLLGSYTLLNLAGQYDVTDRLQFIYRFDNLLNQHYEEVTGFGSPSASAFAGVNVRW